ncbi:MAG: hypothetical protein LBQ30_00030 [Treponema sp.]|jgi:hypothetical protein|nr:hypothetical protein [Treponema sp.]
MAIIRHTHVAGIELTPEQEAALEARLNEAARYPITYDDDCPELTEEQLAEFHPVNGMTWEERARLMRERGIRDPDAAEQETPELAAVLNK